MSNHPEAALRALAEHGLRCDMNPTHDMSSLDASETFWHGYLRMLDANVRQLATNALAAPSPPDSSQGEPVAWLHDVVQNDGSGEQNDQALSFSPDNFPLEGEAPYLWRSLGSKPLYTHPSSPQFADGYAIVPIEPTDAMCDAAMETIRMESEGGRPGLSFYPLHAYRAMLATAPQSAPKPADDEPLLAAKGEPQPIATAPKDDPDGCLIFCPTFYQGKGAWIAGVWNNGEWRSAMSLLRKLEPTHWLPRPAPPAAKGDK